MKLTVEQLLNLRPVILSLSSQSLKALDSHAFRPIARRIGPEAESAHRAQIELMKEHGATEANGIVSLPPDRLEEYLGALKPWLESEVTITAVDPILLTVLKDAHLSENELDLLLTLKLVVE